MAIAAINAIDDEARVELIQSMEKIFLRPNNFAQNGIPIPQDPPMKYSELTKALDTWKLLSNEEKEGIRHEIFGDTVRKPFPFHGHLNEEKVKEMREKWAAMTPEEREAKMAEGRAKWEAMTPEEREELHKKFRAEHINRRPIEIHPVPAHHHGHHADMEKSKEMFEKWEAMTAEEREEFIANKRKEWIERNGDDENKIHRIPRPMPGRNHEWSYVHMNEEKLKEIHDKWEAMTPEEREEARNNKRKEFHNKFESLTPEEEEAEKERIFAVKFPKHHDHRDHPHHFDEEKMAERLAKWESMTDEERDEMLKKFREEHEDRRALHPRFMQIQPLPEFMPGPVPQRPIRSRQFPILEHLILDFEQILPLIEYFDFEDSEESFEDSDESDESSEESDEDDIIYEDFMPYQFVPIRPLPYPVDFPYNIYSQVSILPLPELSQSIDIGPEEEEDSETMKILPYHPRNIQPIRPLPYPNDIPNLRPVPQRPIQPRNVPIAPLPEYFNPIIRPASDVTGYNRQGPMPRPTPEENLRPIRPKPPHKPDGFPVPRPAQFQPIMPLDFQPIMPIQFQPIVPLPEFFPRSINGDYPMTRPNGNMRPVRPIGREPQ